MFQLITGTFLDGIACDIPSNNWTPEIWEREFSRYEANKITDAVIIRVGWADSAMYASPVMQTTLYPELDMVKLFLDLGKKYHVHIWMGLYDTSHYWLLNDWPQEVAVNTALIRELLERYGSHEAFYGWYMSHEGSMQFHQTKIWKPLCQEIRKHDTVRPILVSPRYAGVKYEKNFAVTPEIHQQHLEYILQEMEGLIQIYAPMDGHVNYKELESFLSVTKQSLDQFGMQFWSNLETFDRDMPWNFPPIEFTKLKYKLEVTQKYVSKIISFELPHFMSPDSMYPSARTLYDRYRDYAKKYTDLP